MIDLTMLIEMVIAVACAVATLFVVPWLRSKTTAQQREELLKWVDIAVAAAQQLYHQCSGQQRLQYALEMLEEQGYNIDSAVVRDAVEAAVLKLHQQLKEPTNDG